MISRLTTLSAIVSIVALALPACSSNKCCCRAVTVTSSSAPAPAPTPTPRAEGVVEAQPAGGADDGVSMSSKFTRPGFAVYEEDGRLWVFEMDSEHHDEFRRVGEPAKSVTKIGVGPNGMTVRGAETEVVDSYVAAIKYGRPGFAVFEEDGRVWVFELGSEGLDEFLESGEPAKSVTKIGVGPEGKTIRSVDNETIDAYLASWGRSMPVPPAAPVADAGAHSSGGFDRAGFSVYEEDGRLWVFKQGSEHETAFNTVGEPAKSVTKIGVGPDGMTVRGAESEVVDSYVAAVKYGKPGFAVFEEDGRIWVFQKDSEGLDEFLSVGEPAKSVTKIGVGPDGKSVRSVDNDTIDAFLGS